MGDYDEKLPEQTFVENEHSTTDGCFKICEKKRETDSTVNAVTVYRTVTNTKKEKCYCWMNLITYTFTRTDWKTCFLGGYKSILNFI